MEEPIVLSKNNGGRPRRESSKYCVVHLQIIGLVFSGFEEARRQGEKFDAAIQAAIDKVHSWYPTMSISVAAVKRILADYRKISKGQEVLLFRERELRGKELREARERYKQIIQLNPAWGRGASGKAIVRPRGLEAYYGKFPSFRRVNAVAPKP